MSTTFWQALLALSLAPVEAGWLGIAFASGVVASFVRLGFRTGGVGAAGLPVDDELAFVERVVGRASTPSRMLRETWPRDGSVPPPLPSRERPVAPPRTVIPPERDRPLGTSAPEAPEDADQSTVIDLTFSDLLEQLELEVAGYAYAEEAEEYQTRAMPRPEIVSGCALDAELERAAISRLRPGEPSTQVAPIRAVDVAAVRRRLEHGGRA